MPNFWLGTPPPKPWRLRIAPLRVIRVERYRAVLAVDARWLLWATTICGATPSQCSRGRMVAEWVKRFYEHCIPPKLHPSGELFIGKPPLLPRWHSKRASDALRQGSRRRTCEGRS